MQGSEAEVAAVAAPVDKRLGRLVHSQLAGRSVRLIVAASERAITLILFFVIFFERQGSLQNIENQSLTGNSSSPSDASKSTL